MQYNYTINKLVVSQATLLDLICLCRDTLAFHFLNLPCQSKPVIASTDSHHAAVVNLLREIIMVRDHFLSLPQWFTRDDIDDIIFSISVL